MARIFVGTLLDSQEQNRVAALFEALKASAPAVWEEPANLKFTSAEKLHMTWVFIGDVPQGKLHSVNTALSDQISWIRKQQLAIELPFDKIELWPHEDSPNLLVLTPSKSPQTLFDCAEKIHQSVKPFLARTNDFPFRPHITLARLKNGNLFKNVSQDILKSHMPVTLKLTDIGLFESMSENRKTVYRPVAMHSLEGL